MKLYNLLYYSILNYQHDNLEYIKNNFNLIELNNPTLDSDEILSKVDVLLVPLGYIIDKDKIDKCYNLKVIGSNTTGHAQIDVEYAGEKGIKVVTLKNRDDFHNEVTPAAEFTLGLILALTRNMFPANRHVMSGYWNGYPFVGNQMLSRMSLGIVGLGRLGRKVADYALALGMNVNYYDPFVSCGFPGLEKLESLEALVGKSDVVTVHVPHEKATKNLFSDYIFSKFKPGAYFINTSTGEMVDHDTLLDKLESRHLAGAALDVIEGNFVPGVSKGIRRNKLWQYALKHDNLILTPQIGGSTIDTLFETERHTIESIINLLAGNEFDSKNLPIRKGATWAVIPARGGSKTIPLKNMVPLAGKPLIYYSIQAGLSSDRISRIICSTDNQKIIDYCGIHGVEWQLRPENLASDNIATVNVLLHFLDVVRKDDNVLPEYLVLLEPTSPFVLGVHIDKCVSALEFDESADSAQTVTRVSPNSHAYNQRYHDENGSHFIYIEKRKKSVNKQTKPELYIHGNVRVMRVSSLIRTKDIFGEKSIPIIIPRKYAMDVDGPEDLVIAESMIKTGMI